MFMHIKMCIYHIFIIDLRNLTHFSENTMYSVVTVVVYRIVKKEKHTEWENLKFQLSLFEVHVHSNLYF